MTMGRKSLDPAVVRDTLGVIVKHQEDRAKVEQEVEKLLGH